MKNKKNTITAIVLLICVTFIFGYIIISANFKDDNLEKSDYKVDNLELSDYDELISVELVNNSSGIGCTVSNIQDETVLIGTSADARLFFKNNNKWIQYVPKIVASSDEIYITPLDLYGLHAGMKKTIYIPGSSEWDDLESGEYYLIIDVHNGEKVQEVKCFFEIE